MSRISKSQVNKSLEIAGKNIINAAGADKIASRKEIKDAIKKLESPKEADLTRQFAAFIDARDAKLNARITASDVQKALAYAKDKVLNQYDRNNDGFSHTEFGNMSRLGQLAVEFTLERLDRGPWLKSAADVAAAMGKAMKGQTYMSESDYPYEPIHARNPGNKGLTKELVLEKFKPELKKLFADDTTNFADLVIERSDGAAATAKWLKESIEEAETPAQAKAFKSLKKIVDENLKDVQTFRVGPKGEDGKLAVDQGLYGMLIVGKTNGNDLAGLMYGSVET